MRRFIHLLAVVGLLVLMASPVAAAEGEEPAESEVKAEVTTNVVPAIEQDLFVEDAPEVPAWTYRFMIPGLITLTLLVVIGTTVQYFLRVVRPRYQPAE